MTDTVSGMVIESLDPSRLTERFEEAVDGADGVVERQFAIAGETVLVRYATADMAEVLSRAFAHLEVKNVRRPSLTIYAWESTPGGHDVSPVRATGGGPSYYQAGDGFHALHQPHGNTWSILSTRSHDGWFCMPRLSSLSYWDRSSPFRHLLGWWLETRGYEQIHAGAVGITTGGLLFVGRGGSGKSTATLAALVDSRLRYAGDDYVAVGGNPTPWIHSLYCSAKLDRSHLQRIPVINHAVANTDRPEEDKAVVYVNDAFPGVAVSGFPLRAVIIPRIVDRPHSSLLVASHAEALAALAPSTVLQRRPPRAESLTALARLIERVPAYLLHFGADISRLPDLLSDLLKHLEGDRTEETT